MGGFLIAGAFFVPVAPRANPLVHRALFVGVGAAFLLLSLSLFIHNLRHLGMRVGLHSQGLAIHRRNHTHVLAWDEVETVWHKQRPTPQSFSDHLGSILDGSKSVYTLSGPMGEMFVINALLRDVDVLGQVIRKETLRRLLPRVLEAYEIEGRVEFGKLAISREGLSKGRRTLPWEEVGSVVVENGFVFVKRPQGRLAWFGVRMGTVPNPDVYLALVGLVLNAGASPDLGRSAVTVGWDQE